MRFARLKALAIWLYYGIARNRKKSNKAVVTSSTAALLANSPTGTD